MVYYGMLMLNHYRHIRLFAAQWTTALQALQSMGFSRREYWRRLPCSPPVGLPHPGIKSRSPALQVYSLPSESPPGMY